VKRDSQRRQGHGFQRLHVAAPTEQPRVIHKCSGIVFQRDPAVACWVCLSKFSP
jgi:hypothetical protein